LFVNASGSYAAFYNVTTGALGTVGGSSYSASIVGASGLYRCSVSYPYNTTFPSPQIRACAGDSSYNYTGTGQACVHLWGEQIEYGRYPSSNILNVGTQLTRAADVLTVGTPTNVAPGGFYDVQMVVAPNYAQNEPAADHPWLFFGAGSQLYYKQSDSKLYLQVPGAADIASGALTFARDTGLRVRATHRKGGRRLQVWNDATGASIYDSGPQAAASALSLGANVGVLGGASGATECADLRSMTVFRP
jgi:hypothetical protein